MMEKRESYVYDKTRRYEVEKGTRCTFVLVDIPWSELLANGRPVEQGIDSFRHKARKRYTDKAVAEAADLWWTEFGEPVPWDFVQVLVSHTTSQVAVEFRADNV